MQRCSNNLDRLKLWLCRNCRRLWSTLFALHCCSLPPSLSTRSLRHTLLLLPLSFSLHSPTCSVLYGHHTGENSAGIGTVIAAFVILLAFAYLQHVQLSCMWEWPSIFQDTKSEGFLCDIMEWKWLLNYSWQEKNEWRHMMEIRTYFKVKDLSLDSLSWTCGKQQKSQQRFDIWWGGVVDAEVAGSMPTHFTFVQWLWAGYSHTYASHIEACSNAVRRTCQPPATHLITTRQLHLFGHIARAGPSQDHSRALRAAISHLPVDWRRPPGRPRRIWLRTIELDLQQHNLGLSSAWKRAQDRSKWRKLMETAMSCQGRATRWWWWYASHTSGTGWYGQKNGYVIWLRW